jgi:hypothetical protein
MCVASLFPTLARSDYCLLKVNKQQSITIHHDGKR